MILANARVLTLDPGLPRADAVAVRDGAVVAVGGEAACRAALPGAERRDLGGAVVLPGLCDSHGHVLGLGLFRSELDLTGCESEEAMVARVVAAAGGGDGWLRGFGWDQTRWPGARFPDHRALSAAFPARPVWLTRVDGHAALVNRAALARAGVGRHTPDPPGGSIGRDAGGEPTGLLVDTAMELVRGAIPPPTDGARERLVLDALSTCAALGLCAVHDAGTDEETLALLERLDAEGRLPIRVYAMVQGWNEAALARWLARGPHRGERLTVRCVKLLLDGALGSRGACFHEPYADDPGNRGLSLIEPDALLRLVARIHGAGWQVAMHAIGDAANGRALDALEAAGVPPAARPRIEHAQILRPADLARAARLGAIASVQPKHCTSDMAFAEARLGRARLAGAYAWRSMERAGIPLALGSDFPIEMPDPRTGLHAAITRQDARGNPPGGFLPAERLSAASALAGYTSGAARAAFEEHVAGRIAPGMRADLTVLDLDPLEAAPRAILGAKVLATVVGGRFVVDRL